MQRLEWTAWAFLLSFLAACGSSSALLQPADPVTVSNDIPPRLQWMGNYGYCGEVSFISAGLYYGQYLSQYEARSIASNGVPQNEAKSQLLLGVNDISAARKMHLNAIEWNTTAEPSTDAFLVWVRQNVAVGRPVVIGVYTNEYRFYGNTNPEAGDSSYDHIVPVTAIRSNGAATDSSYNGEDTLTFSDNGLWSPSRVPPYSFNYAFAAFQKTRREANAENGPIYSLANDARNYGIAITGVTDLDHETLPVRVTTNVNYEKPAIENGSSVRPAPMPLTLTITVSNLQPGVRYELFRYNNLAAVPDKDFNANAARAHERWAIVIHSGSTFTMTEHIMSNEIAAYRAVAASAP